MRRQIGPLVFSAAAAVALLVSNALAADAPVFSDDQNFVNLLRLPTGELWRVRASSGFIIGQTSTDNGSTWSATQQITTAEGSGNPLSVVDSSGEIHFIRFVLRDTNGTTVGPNTPLTDRFLDLWHTTSTNNRTQWSAASMIFQGYTSSVMKAIQLQHGPYAGRLVVPFGNRVTNATNTPTGQNVVRVIYSSDVGTTWTPSASVLTSNVPTDWNGNPDGAAEPTVYERNTGELVMYARSQTGFLTTSSSVDGGTTWSPLASSNFYTSTGPPNTVRLDDGRLMMFWNNATMPARYAGSVWYAGRDALHAAISSDDGHTWKGFREIYLDPERNGGATTTGDTGTAYPFPVATADNKVLLITGQANAHTQIKVDPDWLLDTDQHEDFSGTDPLSDWSVFKPYGAVVSVKREREQGAIVEFDASANKNVLRVRKPNANDPDGATWNFPMSKKGETSLRIKLEPGFQGGSIALADHFFEPTDTQADASAIFKIDISSAGALSSGGALASAEWYDLKLQWDLAAHQTNVLLNGNLVGTIAQKNLARPGASYLRLRSNAATTDLAGMKIASVDQIGLTTGTIEEANVLNTNDATDRLTSTAGWTRMRFDNYVPNTNAVTGTVLSANGTFTGFTSPTTGAQAVGITLTSSNGTVEFVDQTGSQVTSDILGPKNGETLTLSFVDKTNIARKATVSGVAFRFGSTIANNAEVSFLDVNGNVLPDYTLDYLSALATGGAVGATGLRDAEEASLIHQIVFRGIGSDAWMLGTFASDPALYDFAFAGLSLTSSYAASNWKTNADGTWSTGGNWTLSRPNAIGAVATFGPAITAPRTITIDANQVVGTLNFDAANAYTLAGTSALTLDGAVDAKINVTSGNHVIHAPVVLVDATTIDFSHSADSLLIDNLQTTSAALTKTGAGTLNVNRLRTGGVQVTGGTLRLLPNGTDASTSVIPSLSIDTGAHVDVANNALIIDYAGVSPLAAIRAAAIDGRLFSSTQTASMAIGIAEATDLGATLFAGQSFSGDALLIRAVLKGDANLSGQVDFDDLLALAQHYQQSTPKWSDGDFDGSGTVNFDDLLAMAQNYGQSLVGDGPPTSASAFEADWALAQSLVPEPTTLAMIPLAAIALRRSTRGR